MSVEKIGALESLLRSPGWALFTEHLQAEWGAAGKTYLAQLDQALNLTIAENAASQARQVRAAQRMVETFTAWPADELGRLKRAQEPMTVEDQYVPRGGYHR